MDANRTPPAAKAFWTRAVIGRAADGISALPGMREKRLRYASRGQAFGTYP